MSNPSLNIYKNSIEDLCKIKGWDTCSLEKVWLLLTEEVGELAGSIRRYNNHFKDNKRVKIEDELGDVFSYLFQLAGMLNIDMDKMWANNYKKSLHKQYIYKDNNEYNKNEHYTRNSRSNSTNSTTYARMV